MAQRKSTRTRAPARSRKAATNGSETVNASHQAVVNTAGTTDSGQSTPPCSSVVSVPSAPRPVRVSPRKRDAPADAPAVEIGVPTPRISRRLSFGTAVSGDEGTPSFVVEIAEKDDDAPPIAVLEDMPQRPTPKPKRKRASPTPTPTPPAAKKGAKKPTLDALDLKAARQANLAKRIRPIARFDSDEEEARSYPPLTSEEKAMIQKCLSEAVGTPVAQVHDGLSYFVDNEDDVENTITSDWSQSPSPRRPPPTAIASSSRRTTTATSPPAPNTPATRRANGKQRGAETPPAVASRPSKKEKAIDTSLAPALRVNDSSKQIKGLNVFGSGKSTSPTRVDDVEVVDFPEIPPILQQITNYLESSGVLSRLRFGEIRPKYTLVDATEPTLPSVLDVLGLMSDNTEALAVYDALLFRGAGVYANPFFADPQTMCVDKNRVVFASGPNSQKPVVFVMPVVVETCHLLSATQIINGSPDKHLRLTGYVFEELFSLFSSLVCTLFGCHAVYAYMNQLCLQFSSRSDKISPASAASSPQKFARNCAAFKPAGSSRNRLTAPRFGATSLSSGVDVRFPNSRAHTDTIPVFDGRHSQGDFRFTVYHWRNVMQLPRYGVPPADKGETPDNALAQDLPSLNPDCFSVALVAFTMGTFGPDDSSMLPVSFNLHFAVLLGTYKYCTSPRVFTVNDLNTIRSSM